MSAATFDVSADADRERLQQLRTLAIEDPAAAQARVWDWLTGIDAGRERPRLDALFLEGTPPASPAGNCEGRVLGLFGSPFMSFVDLAVKAGRALGGIGWTGKTFDPDTGTGYNRLTTTSRIPMFFAMPRYGFERRGGQLVGFRFDHRLERSPLSPDVKVRAVVYADPAYGNPLMLPDTRDELVELVADTYIGRALLCEDGRWRVVAYFALRHPVGGKVRA